MLVAVAIQFVCLGWAIYELLFCWRLKKFGSTTNGIITSSEMLNTRGFYFKVEYEYGVGIESYKGSQTVNISMLYYLSEQKQLNILYLAAFPHISRIEERIFRSPTIRGAELLVIFTMIFFPASIFLTLVIYIIGKITLLRSNSNSVSWFFVHILLFIIFLLFYIVSYSTLR